MSEMRQSQARDVVRRPVTGRLPRWVYRLLLGMAGWFALAAWIFAGPAVTDYLLFIVSGFIVAVAALVLILSRVGRSGADTARDGADTAGDEDQLSFRDRARWDLDVYQSRLTVGQAATQMLLPLATAAFGMTAIGIALHIAEHLGASAS
jgi:hypothetical protein